MSDRPRVGLLCYGLDRPLSGSTRVALELGRELLRGGACDLTFLVPYRRGPFVGEPGARTVYLPGCRLLPGMMAVGPAVIALTARARGLDLVHDPVGISPFMLPRRAAPFRRVTSIHDAIAFEYPGGYPLLNNLLHRRYVPASLPLVDAIGTGSQAARESLTRHLGLATARVEVIPYAISPRFAPVERSAARATAARLGLDGPYLLYVGAFKAHKNVLGAVDAFARAAARLPDHRLALVGPRQWQYPELSQRLADPALGERVRVLGFVPEADLPALYSASVGLVAPSLHEGFGIPPLEAMACDTPVVCSNVSSLPEVVGDAALLVDPHDTAAIADAIVRIATDAPFAAELRARGRRRAAEFSWTRTASGYLELYRRTIASTD